jgi:hypothetical protein
LTLSGTELQTLEGLKGLVEIGGPLQINNNLYLETLAGLENIQASSITGLEITGNIRLSDCAVRSICDYLASPDATVMIENNDPGCNSRLEIEELCDTLSIQEINFNNAVVVSPNPFTTSTTLTYTLNNPREVQIVFYNLQGQVIARILERQETGKQQLQWNAEGLPSGMYYFTISGNSGRFGNGKLLKY